MARKKKNFKFQILWQYLIGSPRGLGQVQTLGVIWIIKDTQTMKEMEQEAVEKMLKEQSHLKAVARAGGAKIWAKLIN